jgi:hypothetical protein
MAQVIPDSWQVPMRFRQRVGNQAGRQRAMVHDGHLLLILHDVPGDNDFERSARVFWRAPDGQWKATGSSGSGLPALRRHVETFAAAAQALDEKVDKGVSAEDFYGVLHKATPLSRTSRNLHKALQEARDAVDDKEIISLRDASGDLERAAEMVVNDARTALEYTAAKKAEEQAVSARKQAESQHRLNLIAALFLPISAFGSVLGINLPSGLEGAGPWLFWVIVVSCFAAGFVIRSVVTSESKAPLGPPPR